MDKYMEELRKERYDKLYNYLLQIFEKGVKILVCGNRFPLKTCAEIMTYHENECYMPDYTWDDEGKMVEVNFDFVIAH